MKRKKTCVNAPRAKVRGQKQVRMAEARRKMGRKRISAGEKANTCNDRRKCKQGRKGGREGDEEGGIKTEKKPLLFQFFLLLRRPTLHDCRGYGKGQG